jgi:surfactin synthase thioesterase subunit
VTVSSSAAVQRNCFRTFVPRPEAQLRLVCFPGAGSGANFYRGWLDLLPPSIELVAAQYPGRQDRFNEAFISDMAVLADEIGRDVASIGAPMAFFGHSLGATIAFEVALRLRPRFPLPVVRLFASARRAPADSQADDGQASVGELGDLAMKAYIGRLHGADSPMLRDDIWQVTAPALRNDLLMSSHYRYVAGSRLTCPITAIIAEQDASTVTLPQVQGWAESTIVSFDSYALPGGHLYLEDNPAPLISLLVEKLEGSLRAGVTH